MMTDQENFNMQVQRQIDAQNEQIKAFVKGLDDFKTEMRDRDNQRAAEIRALDAKMAAMQEATDAKLAKMQEATDAKLEKMQEATDAKLTAMQAVTDAKIAETNEKIATLQASTDARIEKIEKKMDKLADKIEGIGNHVRNLATTAMIGIAAMGATVIGSIVYSIFHKGG